MQRVVSINLDGNVYPLDEKGYTALFAYLDATETRLRDSADRARILADIERTIAEKCQACLGPHKTVITAGEIDQILSELEPVPGPPADAGRAPATDGAAANLGTGEKAPKEGHPHKRLYQIREGGMVGGVCLGLATFLNIDVTVVRILFVLFAISTGGWGFLAYGGLMFILPHATTREQARNPSYGDQQWPWDRDGWPWDRDSWPWDREDWPWDRDERRQARHEQRQARHEQRMERSRARGGSPVFSALVIAFFLMLAFGWLSFWTRGGGFYGFPFFWGGPFYWGFPHWFGIVLFFLVFRFVLRARG